MDRDKVIYRIEAVKADLNLQLKRKLDVFEPAVSSHEMTDFFDRQVKSLTGSQFGQAATSGR